MENANFGAHSKMSNASLISENDKYRQGYFDCAAEIVRFLVGVDGFKINQRLKNDLFNHLRMCFFQENNGVPNSSSRRKRSMSNSKDEPIDMSLKRPRTESGKKESHPTNACSHLRRILETKSHHTPSNPAIFNGSVISIDNVEKETGDNNLWPDKYHFVQNQIIRILNTYLNIVGINANQFETE